MSEWFKVRISKVCVQAIVPWVRIPPSPDFSRVISNPRFPWDNLYCFELRLKTSHPLRIFSELFPNPRFPWDNLYCFELRLKTSHPLRIFSELFRTHGFCGIIVLFRAEAQNVPPSPDFSRVISEPTVSVG